MNRILPRDMLGALRLTGQGRLGEAVAKLREALGPDALVPGEPTLLNPQAAEVLRRVFSPVMPKMFEPAAEPRVPDGSTFEERHFANAVGKPRLQALHPERHTGQNRAAGGHAAWLHAVPG